MSRLLRVTFFTVSAWLSLSAFAQATGTGSTPLVVGTMNMPPFVLTEPGGNAKGLSIELLDLISSELGREYELREFTDIKDLEQAAITGELDLISTIAANEHAESILDLTQPYYRSGYAIAVSSENTKEGWTSFFRSQELESVFSVVGMLVLLWLLAGLMIWLVERRRNRDMFGGDMFSGLGHGIWWAAVTMSTVGYGDKAPVTVAGRVIAIVWMFASIIVVSSFTASISASLTVKKLATNVQGLHDLPNVSVGTLVDSNLQVWLRQRGISASTYPSVESGLSSVAEDEIDAFVFDEAVLKSVSSQKFPGRIYVLPNSFEHYYVTMGVKSGSPIREPVNRAILKILATEDWNRLLSRYLSERS